MVNKNIKIKTISHEDFKNELLEDPVFRKHYNESSFEREIFKAIIRARANKKLTQRELAKKIGVEQSALARFASGRVSPTLNFLKKVVSGLGLSVTIK